MIGSLVSGRWIQRFFRRRAERSTTPWRRKAKAEAEVIVLTSVDVTAARCRGALEQIGADRTSGASEPNVIEVVTPANWKTTGTVVRGELAETDHGTRVTLTAWPGAQLFDWGESRRMVKRVMRLLA
jgi:hypothetical protein